MSKKHIGGLEAARFMWEAGLPVVEIGTILDISTATVRLWREPGWDDGQRSWAKARYRRPWLDELRKRWESGEEMRALAEEYAEPETTLHAVKVREEWDQEAHETARRRGGPTVPEGHRRCQECGDVKPLDAFDLKGEQGHHPTCRECRREVRDYVTEYRTRDIERLYRIQPAHRAVFVALREGRISKPDKCERCGDQPRPDLLHGHHHQGYAPKHHLTVTWLCIRCHGRVHRLERANA